MSPGRHQKAKVCPYYETEMILQWHTGHIPELGPLQSWSHAPAPRLSAVPAAPSASLELTVPAPAPSRVPEWGQAVPPAGAKCTQAPLWSLLAPQAVSPRLDHLVIWDLLSRCQLPDLWQQGPSGLSMVW